MSHHDTGSDRRSLESETVERVIAALREPVPIRPAWRATLFAGINDQTNRPRPTATRWSVRPVTAIAAAIACTMVGATVAVLVLGRSVPPRRESASELLTNLTAATPMPGERPPVSVIRFVLVAPRASRVSLVGDFNRWNPAAMPMRRSADGHVWLLDVPLTPGRHVYSFSVDGDLTADPSAPESGDDDFGVPSSVVLVGGKA